MRFTKMQGAGNDYVYVNAFEQSLPYDLPELARQISDRHFGVGGDGLVVIGPSNSADARMRMFNNDGSEAEMCGNAIRCVGKFVHDHGIKPTTSLQIETGRGVRTLKLDVEHGKAVRARVDMGEPILAASQIPTTLPGERIVDLPAPREVVNLDADWARHCGLEPGLTCVSMGNPHLVMYCRDVKSIPLESIGPQIERAAVFPQRINVHFVQVQSPDEVTMRTWERGSGITLACGTGASAVCVAGLLTKRNRRKILAHLPGGDLILEWSETGPVYMTGPAVEVFHGEWHPPQPASLGFKLA